MSRDVPGPGEPPGEYGQTEQTRSPDNQRFEKGEISLKVAESRENPIAEGAFANLGCGKISFEFHRLGKIAEALAAGAELSEADRVAAAEALRSIAVVLVPTKPGQRSATTRMAQAEHQRLLRNMASTFYADQSASAAAESIAQRLARYRSGPDWKRDRSADGITYRETLRGHCWAVLKVIDRPLSARRIRALLATS
ncbi:hypothetical protein [Bradyrhizobium septentrionale]|uniref:Uncharacterized protein n=1 Tax=Bradyrhizobium septentrionale TaxID=1404411 RepID=A0ABZ2NN53_9BRAD